jgi:hypothetical protein
LIASWASANRVISRITDSLNDRARSEDRIATGESYRDAADGRNAAGEVRRAGSRPSRPPTETR